MVFLLEEMSEEEGKTFVKKYQNPVGLISIRKSPVSNRNQKLWPICGFKGN
jgi:hypothetical protein